jgi:hypothetical protein
MRSDSGHVVHVPAPSSNMLLRAGVSVSVVRVFCFVVVNVLSEHLGTGKALGASQPDARGPGRSSNYELHRD